MENDKKHEMEASNACSCLLGKWTYCECSSLVERHWTKPGSIQCTPRQTFKSTTGTVEYRDILYGSHIHGEYRQDAHADKTMMSILSQRTTGDGPEMTIAASEINRFSGPAPMSGGSMVLEGQAIPFFVGDYLQEACIPLVPKAESRPITTDAVRNARVALHSLRPELWLLVFYHVLDGSSGHPTLLKTEVWHCRPQPKDTPVDRDASSERLPQTQDTPTSPSAFTDLEARLGEVERELEVKRREFEELKSDLEDVKDEHEEAVDEIIDLDLASFGWNDTDCSVESGSAPVPFDGAKWQQHYTSLIDLMERLHELEGEVDEVEDDADDLEREAEDIQEALDQGYSEWEGREYRKAEVIIGQAPAPPPLPEGQLLGEGALACLSTDARKILETYLRLDGIYATAHDLQNLDCGPLVSSMSKLCERILADFLGPRCPTIYADPKVSSLLNDPKRTVSIPTEDQKFKIEKGSLKRVLGLIEKPGPLHLSGTRNGAIALLLFGRTYRMGDEESDEINNPLNVFGTEEARQELRLDLYRFQELRNGFIHHDLAAWPQAQEVKRCFEGCVRKLVNILFGVSPS